MLFKDYTTQATVQDYGFQFFSETLKKENEISEFKNNLFNCSGNTFYSVSLSQRNEYTTYQHEYSQKVKNENQCENRITKYKGQKNIQIV